MENIMKNIVEKMTYKSFENITICSILLSSGIAIYSYSTKSSIPFVSIPLTYAFPICEIFDYEKYTKDIKPILDINSNVTKDFTDLLIHLNCLKPIEIFSATDFALFNNILSTDEFNVGTENVVDISILFKANILNGNGVCRHLVLF